MADIRQAVNLSPDETVEFFRAKGYATQAHWDETWQEEHGRAFTITKMISTQAMRAQVALELPR